MSKLLDSIQDNPKSLIVIDAEDLLEFMNEIFEDAKAQAVEEYHPEIPEKILTRDEVLKELRISSTTLWRWDKCGYLKPIHYGSRLMYRQSDIEAIKNA